MAFWFLLGIVIVGVALVLGGRLRARGRLPFVRHHQNPAKKETPRILGVGEQPGDQHSAGYPGGIDSLGG